ncbi:MAG: enoyl-CoA hydratase/isomerase family protein [Bacteroidetes bacterium]|nr:enoyl-CoA hydratase/isomerase family protein [Bacteroidota bacterium]
MEGRITTSIEDGIGKIVFFHPKSNSLPGVLLDELAKAITDFGTDEKAKVIYLLSEGDKTFCAGASFDELLSINTKEAGKAFFSGFAKVMLAMKACPKFIITKVQGKAIGGGVGIVAASDYSFALQSASVKLSELSIGIGPFVIGPAVERKIGVAAFSALSIHSSQFQSAQWAFDKGLYSSIYESEEKLDEELTALLKNLSASSVVATKKIKEMLWEGTSHWTSLLPERAAISGELVLSDQTKEILSQFKK